MVIWNNGWENTRPLSACIYHQIRTTFPTGDAKGYVSGEEQAEKDSWSRGRSDFDDHKYDDQLKIISGMTNSDLVYIISFNRIKVVEDSVGNVTGDGLSLVLCILNIVLLSFLL